MHKITKKIYYHDTDCGGVAYYANYLKYFEEARTEFFACRGINLSEIAKEGFLFAVRKTDISYKQPARYGQVIEIKTTLSKVKNASLSFIQTAELGGTLLVYADTQIACINKDFKAAVMPDSLLSKLKDAV